MLRHSKNSKKQISSSQNRLAFIDPSQIQNIARSLEAEFERELEERDKKIEQLTNLAKKLYEQNNVLNENIEKAKHLIQTMQSDATKKQHDSKRKKEEFEQKMRQEKQNYLFQLEQQQEKNEQNEKIKAKNIKKNRKRAVAESDMETDSSDIEEIYNKKPKNNRAKKLTREQMKFRSFLGNDSE